MSDDQRVSRHLWVGTNRKRGIAKERKLSGLKKDDMNMVWIMERSPVAIVRE